MSCAMLRCVQDSHLNRAFLLMLSLSIVSSQDSADTGCVTILFVGFAAAQAWPFTEFPEWSVWITLFTLGVYGEDTLPIPTRARLCAFVH